jgi:hypothetical protein
MCIHADNFTIQMQTISLLDEGQSGSSYGPTESPMAAKSRALWRSFLGLHRGVALNVSGGSTLWDLFIPVGSDPHAQHFVSRVALSKISDEIGNNLYSGTTTMTWYGHQRATQALRTKLQTWVENLPLELRFDYTGRTTSDPRSRLELSMYYDSVQMMLWWPFLSEITIPAESSNSARYNQEGAILCVRSALHMFDTLPDTGSQSEIFQILPWWPVIHYLCQAAAVLLLELSLNMQHMQDQLITLTAALTKAIDYLRTFAPHSKSAYRAWNIVRCLFQKVAERYDTHDFPDALAEAERPWNWTEADEMRIEVVRRTLR